MSSDQPPDRVLAVMRVRAEQWRLWRALRLQALADSPRAFGSTYEENVTFPDDLWVQRTRALAAASDRAMFVAVDTPRDVWIGCAGAFTEGDGTANLISMWVSPDHRGRGVGQSLVEAVIDWARTTGYERLRLDVVRGQEAAIRLYQRLGFQATGHRTPMPRDLSLLEDEMVLDLGSTTTQ